MNVTAGNMKHFHNQHKYQDGNNALNIRDSENYPS